MAKPLIYKGEIFIQGFASMSETKPFFNYKRELEAKTAGELLDLMVQESANLAQIINLYIAFNKPSGYRMSDEYWWLDSSHCDLIDDAGNPEDRADISFGGTIDSVYDMVRTVVQNRHFAVTYVERSLDNLRRKTTGEKPATMRDANFMAELNSDEFPTIMEAGKKGYHLDLLIERGEVDGTVKKYLAERKNIRDARESLRKLRIREAQRDKKRELTGKKPFFAFWR